MLSPEMQRGGSRETGEQGFLRKIRVTLDDINMYSVRNKKSLNLKCHSIKITFTQKSGDFNMFLEGNRHG